VLYHLRHACNPFCTDYFGARILLFAQASLVCDPPILCFSLSVGCQVYTTMPTISSIKTGVHRLFFFFFFAWTGLEAQSSQVVRIIGMSHSHKLIFNFLRNCQTGFHSSCSILHFHQVSTSNFSRSLSAFVILHVSY
jgi:hypothetical protein